MRVHLQSNASSIYSSFLEKTTAAASLQPNLFFIICEIYRSYFKFDDKFVLYIEYLYGYMKRTVLLK